MTQARLEQDHELIDVLEKALADLDSNSGEPEYFEILPENEEAAFIFLNLCDQWRVSQVGILGIDGNTVLSYLSICDYPNDRKREIYQKIQLISAGAVGAWRDQAQQQ